LNSVFDPLNKSMLSKGHPFMTSTRREVDACGWGNIHTKN